MAILSGNIRYEENTLLDPLRIPYEQYNGNRKVYLYV